MWGSSVFPWSYRGYIGFPRFSVCHAYIHVYSPFFLVCSGIDTKLRAGSEFISYYIHPFRHESYLLSPLVDGFI